MKTDTNNLVSITEANQNFSKITKLVEQNGDVVILKNNKPQYIVSKFEGVDKEVSEKELLLILANVILTEHKHAFEVLAK